MYEKVRDIVYNTVNFSRDNFSDFYWDNFVWTERVFFFVIDLTSDI